MTSSLLSHLFNLCLFLILTFCILHNFFLFWLSFSLLSHPSKHNPHLTPVFNHQPCIIHSFLALHLFLFLSLCLTSFFIHYSYYLSSFYLSCYSPIFTTPPVFLPHIILPNIPLFHPYLSCLSFCFICRPSSLLPRTANPSLYSSLCRLRTPCSWTRQKSS